MTKVISSQTSSKKYFLTIENGAAVDCTCPDHQYRRHECKHMRSLNAEVARAAAFLALKRRIAAAEREARAASRIAFELAMGF
jgi:hypothetical protein